MTTERDVLKSISDLGLRTAVGNGWLAQDYTPMHDSDLCLVLIKDAIFSTPTVYRQSCSICRDPEYAMMGLPLCTVCPDCGGHVPADDITCDDCGGEQGIPYNVFDDPDADWGTDNE